jgi:hypothetical protein
VANRQGYRIEWRRVTVPLWLLGFLFASILAFAVDSPASSPGQANVTAKVLLTGGHAPYDKECPGESAEVGNHHCRASPSCPSSVIGDSAATVVQDRQVPTITLAGVILRGRPISPEAQPPKFLSRL